MSYPPGTAVRHFNVMHHMMKSRRSGGGETARRSRARYLSEDELRKLKRALDEKIHRKGTNDFNKTFVV